MSSASDRDTDQNAPSAFQRGVEIRSRVLGADYVETAGGRDGETMSVLQRMVTEFGWGTVWARGQLTPRQRSLATVSMLIALGRLDELRTHAKGALRNGFTEIELREVAVHSVAYCGFPAALEAGRIIEDVIARSHDDSQPSHRNGERSQ